MEIAPPAFLEPGVHGALWRRDSRRRYGQAPQIWRELVVLHARRGRMRYLINDRRYELTPGALLFAYSGQAHVLLAEEPDFDMWVAVLSRELLASEPCCPPHAQPPGAPQLARLDPETDAGLERLAFAVEGSEAPDLRGLGLRFWAARAWAALARAGQGAGAAITPACERAALALDINPAATLEATARRAGLSLSRLGRLFKKEIGVSLTAYRDDKRLALIDRTLAREPERSLTHAAFEAGYGSYAQFYRVFMRRRGVNPRAFYRPSDAARALKRP